MIGDDRKSTDMFQQTNVCREFNDHANSKRSKTATRSTGEGTVMRTMLNTPPPRVCRCGLPGHQAHASLCASLAWHQPPPLDTRLEYTQLHTFQRLALPWPSQSKLQRLAAHDAPHQCQPTHRTPRHRAQRRVLFFHQVGSPAGPTIRQIVLCWKTTILARRFTIVPNSGTTRVDPRGCPMYFKNLTHSLTGALAEPPCANRRLTKLSNLHSRTDAKTITKPYYRGTYKRKNFPGGGDPPQTPFGNLLLV